MSDVWAYLSLHVTASLMGLVPGLIGGFAAGRVSARWPESRIERFRTIVGALIALMAFGTMLRVFVASDHQTVCNEGFRDGIAARSAAQQAATDAELVFLHAQKRFATAMNGDGVTQAERAQAVVDFQAALDAKERSLAELNRVRVQTPVEPPADC